jgi:metal-responsive CopG/Arc/MetJ family transcriptional regulator
MGRRISVYLEDDVVSELNEATQASPLSRSELVSVALRRFLRDERRRSRAADGGSQLARRIAAGDLPSQALDGRLVPAQGAPWGN